MTFHDIIVKYRSRHDFNKPLSKITRANLILMLSKQYEHPTLKVELKKCGNLNQMINTIEQKTGELTKTRPVDNLNEFQTQLERIIKFARL